MICVAASTLPAFAQTYTITDLGPAVLPNGINASGTITGSVGTRAFVYNAGTMTDLGTLGDDWSQAWAINASGQITGQAYLPGNVSAHAFLYSGGTMKDLGALYQYSTGRAINSAGPVVGSANVRSASTLMVYHAVLFRSTGPVDLNRLIPARSGWVLSEATGVNDSGQIVGYGSFHGVDHGFLLTPR